MFHASCVLSLVFLLLERKKKNISGKACLFLHLCLGLGSDLGRAQSEELLLKRLQGIFILKSIYTRSKGMSLVRYAPISLLPNESATPAIFGRCATPARTLLPGKPPSHTTPDTPGICYPHNICQARHFDHFTNPGTNPLVSICQMGLPLFQALFLA